jgi:hypothetical protein
LAALFAPGADEYWLNASNVDESELPDRDQPSHAWVGLLHRLVASEPVLINFPSTPRNDKIGHEQKAWAPDRKHPKHHSFYRVHARPRHDRCTKSGLILSITKRKLLCGAIWQREVDEPIEIPDGN